MGEPTIQSLADELRNLVARVDDLSRQFGREINRVGELLRDFGPKITALESGSFPAGRSFTRDDASLVINPKLDFETVLIRAESDGVLVDSVLAVNRGIRTTTLDAGGGIKTTTLDASGGIKTTTLDASGGITANELVANKLRSTGQIPLEITATQLHVHASDLILDGRTKGNGRALVDDGKTLILNFNNDFENGVSTNGNFSVDGTLTAAGGIDTPGGDIAEQFDLANDAFAEPGTVMVVGTDGKLEPCTRGNDARVAGVVSGAAQLMPALVLNKKAGHRVAIVLVGSVYCRCDASFGPIAAGDILTTSQTVGHAMRANDVDMKIGATIGKALKPLPAGTGLIPILVAPR